jgi:hypothetical protein
LHRFAFGNPSGIAPDLAWRAADRTLMGEEFRTWLYARRET